MDFPTRRMAVSKIREFLFYPPLSDTMVGGGGSEEEKV